MDNKPVILITNDDGITAPGIYHLIEVARKFGTVVVVAPDKPQSGMGHAITINAPLRLTKMNLFESIEAYQCSGTPVDCVKIAVDKILHKKPDLCLSGINHGANHSINILYSGTMSAAMEGAIEGIPSVGFSLLDFSHDANFELAKHVVEAFIPFVLNRKNETTTLFNINIPKIPLQEFKGLSLAKQSKSKWEEHYVERLDPMGKTYYWLSGEFICYDNDEQNDDRLLKKGYATVVPIGIDLTNYKLLDHLSQEKIFEHV